MLEKLHKFLLHFLIQKHFTFRFQYYDRDEVINDTNVIEYEFINVGGNSVFINGMELQPDKQFSGGGIFPASYQNTFRRWKGWINYNEKDTTIYRLRFPIELACVQTCSTILNLPNWVTCNGLPPTCEWLATLYIGGVAITNPFNVNCNTGGTANLWQQSIDNNLLPSFTGSVVVTFIATANPLVFDIQFEILNYTIGCEAGANPSIILQDITPPPPIGPPILCPLFTQNFITPSCQITPVDVKENKLLVISKCLAGLKDNP